MMIQGKSCTLTVAKDGYYYPLPYSEETIRQASKGYALPAVIGKRNRERLLISGSEIQGCFITRLEYQNILSLFFLLFFPDDKYDLLADRVFEKIIYQNLSTKQFELRADNSKPFYLRLDIKNNDDSATASWSPTTPSLGWRDARTYFYDGHKITADTKQLPLVYRFELTGIFSETAKYEITLFFPLSTEHFPKQESINKLVIKIDEKDGITLNLEQLEPVGDMVNVNCPDTVLCYQKFYILGDVSLTIRNKEQHTTVVL